ncbi:dihydropteroate synthase, partial [Acinetobacter baumannii]|uniref:dihydropteroate synthase n=1 Tax=Acinetobacter baumannii TaxID=470 RepID=UPI0020917D21
MNKSLIIFGIVNITSDSFSDGGRYLAPDAAIAQARKLMAEGADVIDLGPASSNPDAAPVSSDTEIARIAPVLDALKADGIPVSLDSYQPATQAYALSRGVAYLNDRAIYYNEQHIAFADNVRRFVQKEMAPFVNEWDEAETFPRELYKKAAEIGLLGLGFS